MKKISVLTLSILLILSQLAAAAEFRFSPRPNRAHQISWRAWSREALQEARRSQRPVLLALSAVWCHWCHVMDETTYSDPAVIAFIQKNFIAVRVDADRRPDIDALYNQGGWPSTVILTPEGEVMAGATYLPPDEMLPWLMKHAAVGTREKDKPAEDEDSSGKAAPAQSIGDFPAETDIAEVAAMLLRQHDDHWGGFGEWQKFPNPDAVDFLLAEYRQTGKPEYRRIIAITLDRMERGDIQDHVEGGFFTVDVNAIRAAAEELPWVYKAAVKRVWPATLQIFIEEQQVIAHWGERGYLNRNGEPFFPVETSLSLKLPALAGPTGHELKVLENYQRVAKELAPLGLQVTSMELDSRRAWHLQVENGVLLELGRADTRQRLQRFIHAYPTVFAGRIEDLRRVDLRYSNGFSVYWQQMASNPETGKQG